ncbi:MAG TPA: DUF2867 domain-containing protein, partial [Anaerolineales bacterium]|nr:DUF2867 domain-containing protein [Anaerolineales bacterium]
FIDHRETIVQAEPGKVLEAINRFEVGDAPKGCAPLSSSLLLDSKAILIHLKDTFYGNQWIEWRIAGHAAHVTCLTQTVFFYPRGLPGFLYWYLFYPFHFLEFRGLIKSIARQSETQ